MAHVTIAGISFRQLAGDINPGGFRNSKKTGNEIGNFEFDGVKLFLLVLPQVIMDRFADFAHFFRKMDSGIGERPA